MLQPFPKALPSVTRRAAIVNISAMVSSSWQCLCIAPEARARAPAMPLQCGAVNNRAPAITPRTRTLTEAGEKSCLLQLDNQALAATMLEDIAVKHVCGVHRFWLSVACAEKAASLFAVCRPMTWRWPRRCRSRSAHSTGLRIRPSSRTPSCEYDVLRPGTVPAALPAQQGQSDTGLTSDDRGLMIQAVCQASNDGAEPCASIRDFTSPFCYNRPETDGEQQQQQQQQAQPSGELSDVENYAPPQEPSEAGAAAAPLNSGGQHGSSPSQHGGGGGGAAAAPSPEGMTDAELALQLQQEEQQAHLLELAGYGAHFAIRWPSCCLLFRCTRGRAAFVISPCK